MPDATLRTVSDVVEALGGTFALARRLDRTPQQVSNWRTNGRFPDWTFPIVTADLEKKDLQAARKLWPRLAKFAS